MCDLSGVRVVVTRATHQAEELATPLRNLGAEVLLAPLIAIAEPADPGPLREAAAQCDQYDWIIFTSANAVRAFVAELPEPRGACTAGFAAIGTATRDVAQENGLVVSVVPEKYVAESLAEALGSESLDGKRILIPSAAVTRDVLPRTLSALGASVQVVEAYRNVIPTGAGERLREVLDAPLPDWVTFASSSAVDNAVAMAGADCLKSVKILTVGPITSQTVRAHGLVVAAEARVYGVQGMIEALRKAERRRTC